MPFQANTQNYHNKYRNDIQRRPKPSTLIEVRMEYGDDADWTIASILIDSTDRRSHR